MASNFDMHRLASGTLALIFGVAARASAQCPTLENLRVCGDPTAFVEYRAIETFDAGLGQELYLAGRAYIAPFCSLSSRGVFVRLGVSGWDSPGGIWVADVHQQLEVNALTVHDDGGGRALYAGGRFSVAGGTPAMNVARWDGSTWSALGPGLPGGWVRALASFDDGTGSALYAGGGFWRWQGGVWSSPGGGIDGIVQAFTTYDDGSGARLVVAGWFASAGGAPANNIAAWNGASWSYFGGGLDIAPGDSVRALATFDDGSGLALYAGGDFDGTPTAPLYGIARWRNGQWEAVDVGIGSNGSSVNALRVHDDRSGNGPALYACGSFAGIAGEAGPVARWNGARWTGLGHPNSISSQLNALGAFDFGGREARDLVIAGAYRSYPTNSWGFGRWKSCAGTGTLFCNGQPPSAPCPCGGSATALLAGGCPNSAGDAGLLRALGLASISADTLVLHASGRPSNGPVLFFQGTTKVNGGAGAGFGEGLSCAGGAVTRLAIRSGEPTARFPSVGDPAVSTAGTIQLPGTRTYQALYRDPHGLCSAFNLTNGVEIAWGL